MTTSQENRIKERVLTTLRSSDSYVSGEEISRFLGVTRTAVWKVIKALRDEGYGITSDNRKGYRLDTLPDILYPQEIQEGLDTRYMGRAIRHCYRAGSTNDLAKEWSDRGAVEGSMVIAEQQLSGRGRLGRSWVSPPGRGIWMSLILRPKITPPSASQLTLLAAVATAKALREVTGVQVGIKWPNDLLVEGRKVCGILTEMRGELDIIHYVVIGIGINVNMDRQDFPPEVASNAGSFKMILGRDISRVIILRAVLKHLEGAYEDFLENGFAGIRDVWKEMSITLGQNVSVTTVSDTFEGVATDIDEDGALLIETGGEIHRLQAGEITLSKEKPPAL